MNGEHIRAPAAAPSSRRRCCRSRATRYGDRLDIRAFEAAVALAQERATTLVQIAEQVEFLFVPDDELEIDADVVGRRSRSSTGVDDVLDAVIEHVERCEWTRRDRPAAGRSTRSG